MGKSLILVILLLAGCGKPVEGIASWYGEEVCISGVPCLMANGETFKPEAMTAAMWDIPLGTNVRVRNNANGRTTVVKITDRGPHKRLGRLIDLSSGAFSKIASLDEGLINVTILSLE